MHDRTSGRTKGNDTSTRVKSRFSATRTSRPASISWRRCRGVGQVGECVLPSLRVLSVQRRGASPQALRRQRSLRAAKHQSGSQKCEAVAPQLVRWKRHHTCIAGVGRSSAELQPGHRVTNASRSSPHRASRRALAGRRRRTSSRVTDTPMHSAWTMALLLVRPRACGEPPPTSLVTSQIHASSGRLTVSATWTIKTCVFPVPVPRPLGRLLRTREQAHDLPFLEHRPLAGVVALQLVLDRLVGLDIPGGPRPVIPLPSFAGCGDCRLRQAPDSSVLHSAARPPTALAGAGFPRRWRGVCGRTRRPVQGRLRWSSGFPIRKRGTTRESLPPQCLQVTCYE